MCDLIVLSAIYDNVGMHCRQKHVINPVFLVCVEFAGDPCQFDEYLSLQTSRASLSCNVHCLK